LAFASSPEDAVLLAINGLASLAMALGRFTFEMRR
jgi:hypothetical protein